MSDDFQSFKITTNWKFTPSVVILNFDSAYVYLNEETNKKLSVNSKYAYDSSNYAKFSTLSGGYSLHIYLTIQSDGFTIHVRTGGNYGAIYAPITWEAYE